VSPKTVEFLYYLLWSADTVLRPGFRNLDSSFESWAYRNGLLMQLHRLERQKWIERKVTQSKNRLYRLTDEARLVALGGRDPEKQWARPWDGMWRMVLFDLPVEQNSQRERLRRYLRARHFGYLQKSVWITPDQLTDERQMLAGGEIDVESLILLETRPCTGESDMEIVGAGWDFERINRRYSSYLKHLEKRPTGSLRGTTDAKVFRRWAAKEREIWARAVEIDPLLPEELLPSGYFGQRAWQRRIEVLRVAGQQLRSFHSR